MNNTIKEKEQMENQMDVYRETNAEKYVDKKKWIIAVVCIIIALVSFFAISKWATSVDTYRGVLGTLNDAKTSYTTATGQIVNVKSVTDTMVTDEDGTVHTINTKKIYKTDAAGNYVDANGNVLTPIQWNVDAPYRIGKIVLYVANLSKGG